MSSFEERVRQFLKHFEELEATSGDDSSEDGYNREFMELKTISQAYKDNDTFPADSGKLACNKKKNRFKDILPFEHTRVALHPEEGVEGSDYINANYITDSSGDVMYIASQGPLPHTVNDFWRMLWYHNIEVVVMACREVEMGKQKCECYWGEPGEKKMFGPIEVTTVKETNVSNDFVIRDVMAECQGETQNIRQYHYTAWPDHLKPTSIYPILRMIQMLHDSRERPKVPIVVHCSAGCGRTGTIITIDIIRAAIKAKDTSQDFSVYDIVKQLRTMRPAMVQARDQYHFVYQAASILAKNFLEGNTTLQKPPLPAAKPGSKPPEGKEPKHDYENWSSIDSAREKLQKAESKPSPPVPSAKPGGKPSEGAEPKHDYENWADIDSVREKIQKAEGKAILASRSLGSSLEEPPKPMPRKKSLRPQVAKAGDGSPPTTAKGGAPGTSPKPKSAESSPPVAKKPSPGSPPKVAKKPTGSPKVAKKPMAPPKTGASAMPAKKPSIMELLMQECGDILDEENDVNPSVAMSSPLNEETDAPPVPCQTEESLKLVSESSYDVPGFTYDIPKSPTETAFPQQQLNSSHLPPVGGAPPPIPTTKPPQRSSSPQQGHVTPVAPSGSALGSGGGSTKAKGLKNLFAPKKGEEKKKKGFDISGPTGLQHTGGSGGVPGAMFSVSPVSHPSSPEPDGAEYATPILDQPRHTPVNSSRFHFAGENGFGKRIAKPRGPRKEPLHWNSGQFRRPLTKVDQIA